ncbi:MAG TPA: invasin domain 3-containing protein [Thermoanaerobaculia bacterium]|jgi:adhesin/invasin|nr:invasin domain 3-containing protein [Thermoanaerobaculia bacterium]
MKRLAGLPVLLCLLVPFLGCDKATPVAPSGTTLTISANPTKIGLTGSSTITVVGRKPDGNPLNPGTEIRLSSDRGTVSPSVVEVDSSGRATATLRGDGRKGAAKVTAAVADATAEISVQIGESDETTPSLIVSVNPSVIPVSGTSTITVVARNADGSSVGAGQQVILTSTLGTITPSRPTTKADGTATATLTAGAQSGTAKISAVLGSSAAATADVEIKDAILTLTADKTSVQEGVATTIRFTAFVTAFQGDPIKGKRVDFRAERGTWTPSSATTDDEGKAVFVLSLPAEAVNSDETFQAVASMISGSGTPITATLDITIRNNP